MGNHPSQQESLGAKASFKFLRGVSNALGLSKSELDARCRPSGLYPSCHWEDKVIRRLIGDGKLAARLRGTERRAQPSDQECPICFLHYSEINTTKCCQAVICTECYLQVKPQKDKSSCCPFCNHERVSVCVAKSLDANEIQERENAERRVSEAHLRARQNQQKTPEKQLSEAALPVQFGASLAENTRVTLLRARSDSMESVSSETDIVSMAVSPEERRALEAEMQAQNLHPLAQRLKQEETDRRLQNELEYYRNLIAQRQREQEQQQMHRQQLHQLQQQQLQPEGVANAHASSDNTSSSRGPSSRQRSGRDWNRIVDAFENGGNGHVQSLDDLVVLEAAIMLSMQEEENRRHQEDASSTQFDAEAHASRGFPLARARVQHQDIGSLVRTYNAVRHSERSGMRGLSEEEQLAMAIAASLEERHPAEASVTANSSASEPNTPTTNTTTTTTTHDHDEAL